MVVMIYVPLTSPPVLRKLYMRLDRHHDKSSLSAPRQKNVKTMIHLPHPRPIHAGVPLSRECAALLLALACLAGVSAADGYNITPITDTNLNGDAASGEMNGNPRYFDWDTPDEPHLAWASEDILAGGSASIVVADDTVFVYCTGNEGVSSSDYTYMVALNATNREMLWATEIAPSEYGSGSSPAYHNGSIFIASGMHVYRIAGDTGAIL